MPLEQNMQPKRVPARCGSEIERSKKKTWITPCFSINKKKRQKPRGHLRTISGFPKKDPGVNRGLVMAMLKPTIRYLDNAPPTGWSHHQVLSGHAPQSLCWRPVFNTIGSEQRDLVWQPQLQLAHKISI